jgi:tRNA A-37 threonylcarbamoyl transferase component Bud32
MADTQAMSSTSVKADFNVGDLIDGRYELRRDLGQGAAGRVFEARHQFTGRHVALKLVAPDVPYQLREELYVRLKREARALASVRHPGVVDVLDGGFLPDGTPYLVMEMLEGRTLEGLIAARGRIPVADTVALAFQLSLALEASHAAGVVHRDVKPSNILIVHDHARREVVKVVDFGIARLETSKEAKLTGIGALIGTPGYMAPEQLLGLDDVDKRSDIYALGVTMFECLTGQMPYEGNYQRVLLQVCSNEPVPAIEAVDATIPAALAAVVKRTMAKERDERFASMAELRKALVASDLSARKRTYFFNPPPAPVAAPSAAAAPAEVAPAQRRKLVRASYVTPVHLVMGDVTIDARTEDISTGGLLVICRQLCPTDRRGTIRFALPMDGLVVALDVHVRWVRAARADDPEGPRALGVEFIDPPADMTASIERYVSFMTVPEA